MGMKRSGYLFAVADDDVINILTATEIGQALFNRVLVIDI